MNMQCTFIFTFYLMATWINRRRKSRNIIDVTNRIKPIGTTSSCYCICNASYCVGQFIFHCLRCCASFFDFFPCNFFYFLFLIAKSRKNIYHFITSVVQFFFFSILKQKIQFIISKYGPIVYGKKCVLWTFALSRSMCLPSFPFLLT